RQEQPFKPRIAQLAPMRMMRRNTRGRLSSILHPLRTNYEVGGRSGWPGRGGKLGRVVVVGPDSGVPGVSGVGGMGGDFLSSPNCFIRSRSASTIRNCSSADNWDVGGAAACGCGWAWAGVEP